MICMACGEDFKRTIYNQKYCSDKCRWRDKSRRYRARAEANTQVHRAIRKGELIRPKECSLCGEEPEQTIQGHHPDYDKPLHVLWLCSRCHQQIHKTNLFRKEY